MNCDALEFLACPACRGPLTTNDTTHGRLLDGLLRCEACSIAFPVAEGFVLFGEARLDDGVTDPFAKRSEPWFQDRATYEQFLRTKAERRTYDAYAMFQPYNESLRSLLALIEPIRTTLSPGDVILDTWCRTGWTGAWLASLFPEQRVISIWEGDKDTLGYSGFAYWLPESERRDNWDIVFTSPDEPLPFADGTFGMLHGYDSLHRYRQSLYLSECRRVTAPGRPMLFSHIHLSNDEPDPWFERGCVQLHGSRYRAVFDRVFAKDERKGFVFGEQSLFESGDAFTFDDAPQTPNYNAAALVGPASWEGQTFATEQTRPVTDASSLVVNPLLTLNLESARVSWSYEDKDGQVGHLLRRHPCYEERLGGLRQASLEGRKPELLYYAAQLWTFGQIADHLGGDREALRAEAAQLVASEAMWPAEISPAMARLQHYFGTSQTLAPGEDRFSNLWRSSSERYGDRPIIETEDGTELTAEIVGQLVDATCAWLLRDTKLGDRILLYTPNCPEAYVVIWSCWLTGRVIVPVEPDLPLDAVEALIERSQPTLAFANVALSTPTHQFDSFAEEDSTLPPFSGGIAPFLEANPPPLPEVDPHADAAILFTSGSTGRPKGVRLAHGALSSSGIALARYFEWTPGDRLYAGGASYSMSGLRNPALGALAAGTTIVIPDPGPMNPLRAYELLRKCSITVVTTVPAQLSAWLTLRERLKDQPRPCRLRAIAYTGHGISPPLREQIAGWLEVEVTGYYGLTETCGLCLGDELGVLAEGNIGYSVAALAQVVDPDGRVLPDGERGELRVTSPRIMNGYLEADTRSTVRRHEGWLYTGDAAIRQPDGSFELVGRFDDQVKDRFGDTVFPSEVEGVTGGQPGITDCCCLAMHTEAGSASLILFLVVADGVDPTEAEARVLATIDARLGVRKRPARIIHRDQLPRKTSGKIDRPLLLSQAGLE